MASLFHGPLTEQYRPRTWTEVVAQPKAVQQLLRIRDRGGFGGRAFFISGKSGTGKTTLGRLIAAEVADEFMVQEIDATTLTIAGLKDIAEQQHTRGWGDKPGRAFILNEVHGLRKDVIRSLLVLLDTGAIPAHVTWVLTTTREEEESLFEDYDDASPLLSRCFPITLATRDTAKPFAVRAKEIAEKEGLDGQPLERYVRLVNEHRGNFRAVLTAIEAGEMAS
jgi:replication-associated recombination protein RarA